jgi:filamentous hemagglutinin family protein
MKQPLLRFWLFNSSIIFYLLHSNATTAQIVPDTTLPANSSVMQQGNTSIIEGGTTAGTNLFHSFKDFSVPNGAEAFFNNASDIQNIFSRVTGGNISNIDGLIRANGVANLFLINPNGIILGQNARLNIGGSFLASTASSIRFGDGMEFSATNSNAPPLLTINVPIGLQYGSNTGNIQVQGSNLQVNRGNFLALLGGSVSIDGGQIAASGGRVELGGLAETGTIGLFFDSTGNILSSSFPTGVQRGNVSLSNSAQVDVTAPSGGSIAVNTRNLDISGRGKLSAGISENSGSVGAVAGDITVDATGAITFQVSSLIQNIVNTGATGNAGNINIQAGSLNLLSGSQLFTSTFGQGNAGRVNVNVSDTVSIDSAGNNTSTSGIISSLADTAVGNGGDINITTRSLSVTNGAQMNAIAFGGGNAGNVIINASDTVSFDGANVGASGILNAVAPTGKGNGGDINITTASLSVTNGAQLNTITRGRGNAGNVTINASNRISIDGENPKSVVDPFSGVSSIFTSVGIDDNGNQAIGNGGNINITTGSLSMTNGGQLNAITRGQGNAGNVIINARDTISLDGERQLSSTRAASAIFTSVDSNEYSGYPNLGPAIGNGGDINITTGSLFITNGAALSGLTKGQGNAGNVIINARDTVSLDGENTKRGASGIFSSVADNLYTGQPPARGNGGDINITTGSLLITRGAGLFANTRGQGDAGNVMIDARDRISLDGENSNGGASGIFSSVGDENDLPPAIGNGSNIYITTGALSVTRGAGVFANTAAQGNAGNAIINAREVSLDGVNSNGGASGIFSDVKSGAVGNGREIRITAGALFVTNGARLSTTSAGNGAAGNIVVDANSIRLVNGAIASDTVGGEGNITLRSRSLILRRGSSITTNAQGDNIIGGNITIDADVLAALENSDITANSRDARGGNVTINSSAIFGTQFRNAQTSESDITATGANSELSGTVQINTPDVDPSSGLIELPANTVDPTRLIAQGCPANRGNSFTVTGRGGLPPSPSEPLRANNTVSVNWVTRDATQVSGEAEEQVSGGAGKQIIEATGWIVNEKGQVVLIASKPNTTPSGFLSTSPSCP